MLAKYYEDNLELADNYLYMSGLSDKYNSLYRCICCGKTFKKYDLLIEHMENTHKGCYLIINDKYVEDNEVSIDTDKDQIDLECISNVNDIHIEIVDKRNLNYDIKCENGRLNVTYYLKKQKFLKAKVLYGDKVITLINKLSLLKVNISEIIDNSYLPFMFFKEYADELLSAEEMFVLSKIYIHNDKNIVNFVSSLYRFNYDETIDQIMFNANLVLKEYKYRVNILSNIGFNALVALLDLKYDEYLKNYKLLTDKKERITLNLIYNLLQKDTGYIKYSLNKYIEMETMFIGDFLKSLITVMTTYFLFDGDKDMMYQNVRQQFKNDICEINLFSNYKLISELMSVDFSLLAAQSISLEVYDDLKNIGPIIAYCYLFDKSKNEKENILSVLVERYQDSCLLSRIAHSNELECKKLYRNINVKNNYSNNFIHDFKINENLTILNLSNQQMKSIIVDYKNQHIMIHCGEGNNNELMKKFLQLDFEIDYLLLLSSDSQYHSVSFRAFKIWKDMKVFSTKEIYKKVENSLVTLCNEEKNFNLLVKMAQNTFTVKNKEWIKIDDNISFEFIENANIDACGLVMKIDNIVLSFINKNTLNFQNETDVLVYENYSGEIDFEMIGTIKNFNPKVVCFNEKISSKTKDKLLKEYDGDIIIIDDQNDKTIVPLGKLRLEE